MARTLGLVLLLAACGGPGAAVDGPASKDSQGIDAPTSSVPTEPIEFSPDTPFTIDSGTVNTVDVPASYDPTHQTPMTLLVWLHGCGGFASGDIFMISPQPRDWISLAVGGQEGNCWDVDHDGDKALAAIADLRTHFNIAPKQIVLGGYSSGGDLTYRLGFHDTALFAGLIVENTSPFRDTGSSQADSLAAAAWKINIVHLAHLQDDTYQIAGVRTETDAVIAAGFPLMRIEQDGGHYDDPGAMENGHAVPGTSADLVQFLLPELDAGWRAP